MDYQDFGHRVRELRRQKGLTQEELSEEVGISASFMGHIERGTRVASLETLVALCNTLNVAPEYLLQASLNNDSYPIPQGLSAKERALLSRFLHMAEATVRGYEE
ncbi:MAG: helix-turn-helix transcriptional regulator [Clostridiales bacterium]|nr:helix-turn-helix transcriptional regulator [Clostridiales bacterium]